MSPDETRTDAAPAPKPARFEPPVGEDSGPFWEATRRGTLVVQWCSACDRGIFYPRAFCPHCDGRGVLFDVDLLATD